MIQVDISNIWGEVSLPDLLGIEREIGAAHAALTDGSGAGSDLLGWLTLPELNRNAELQRIQAVAERIRGNSDVLVVVGIGGSYLGARAGIELLQGGNRNAAVGRGEPQIFYAGNSLSTRQWNELLRLLEGKDFTVAVISKSGATTEPAIALRSLKWLLERRYGTAGAKKRIIAITDPVRGSLRRMASEEGWETFTIPASVTGSFSALTAAGLLPMAVAGLDVRKIWEGAREAVENYHYLRSFENPVWLYAGVRSLMQRSGKAIELMASFEPGFEAFGKWWQQLFAGGEGKNGKGLLPVSAEYTADLHTLGQMIQQGQQNLFETLIRFEPVKQKVAVMADARNLDGLNYLQGRELDFVEEQACQAVLEAHVDAGVPVITMDLGELNEKTLGGLFYFFQLSCGISAYVLGVDPFRQPGAEVWKRSMLRLLGKPGYENG